MQQSNYNRTGGLKYWEIRRLNYLKNEMMKAEMLSCVSTESPEYTRDESIKASVVAYEKTQEFIDYLRQVNDRYLSYPNDNIYANGLCEYIINEMYSYKTEDDGFSAYVFRKAVTESGCRFLIDALNDVDRRIRTAM